MNYFVAVGFVVNVVVCDAYTPNEYVKFGHSFSSSNIEISMGYLTAVLKVPAALFILGLLSLIFLNVGFIGRCCCTRCECGPEKTPPLDSHPDVWIERIRRKGQFYVFGVFILGILIVSINQLIFIGSDYMDKGTSTSVDTLNSIKTIFVRFDTDGKLLTNYGTSMSADLASTSCSQAKSQISSLLSSYNSKVDSFNSLVRPTIRNLDSTKENTQLYTIYYRQLGMYGVYAIGIVSALIFIICQYFRTTCGLKFAMVWGEISYFIILIITALLLIVTVVLSDFCYDPNYFVQNVIPSDNLKNVTSYFSTCKGVNPLQNFINTAETSALQMNSSISLLLYTSGSPCAGDSYLISMQQTSLDIFDTINDVSNNLLCKDLKAIWDTFIESGICNNIYMGFFSIWTTQLVTSFLLFLLIIMASISYQYFDPRIEFSERNNFASNPNVPLSSNEFYGNVSPSKSDQAWNHYP
eukprot:gene596-1152_t